MSKLMDRRNALRLGLSFLGVALLPACKTTVNPPQTSSRPSIPDTFRIPGFGRFPIYFKDSNVGPYLGDKVEGGTFRVQRNRALAKDKITGQVSRNGVNIRQIASSGSATAFKVTVNRQDYIMVQNDDIPDSNGSNTYRCDALIFPICVKGKLLPEDDEINQAQSQIEAVLSSMTGTDFYLVSYEAGRGEELECRPERPDSDDRPATQDTPETPAETPEGGCQDCGGETEAPTGPGGGTTGPGGGNPSPDAGANGPAGAGAQDAPEAPAGPSGGPNAPSRSAPSAAAPAAAMS